MNKAMIAIRLFAINLLFGKDGRIMMAMFFAQRVILGKTTFEQVPKALKKGVAEVLIDSGLPELVPTEYGGTAEAFAGSKTGAERSAPFLRSEENDRLYHRFSCRRGRWAGCSCAFGCWEKRTVNKNPSDYSGGFSSWAFKF